jgi:hypothetical protein
MKYLIIVILLAAVLITAGCTRSNQNVVAAPTATPAPTITTISTLIQTTVTTATPNVTIIKNVVVKPTAIQESTVIDNITFLTFNNGKVSIKYPSTWVANETMTADETMTLRYYNNKIPLRGFTITNPDKTVMYTVSIWSIGTNAWRMNENIIWVYNEVGEQFPDYVPESITMVDKRCSIDGIYSCVKYTVTIPTGIKLFRYRTVTLRYGYMFELSSANATIFDNYKNLVEYMTNTIEISDTRTT